MIWYIVTIQKKGNRIQMKSIKTKLIIITNGLTLMTCLILGIIAFVMATFTVEESIIRDLKIMAQQTAHTVEATVNSKIETLQTMAANELISNPDESVESKVSYLKKEVERTKSISISYIDEKGNYYGSDGSTSQVADQDHFKSAMAGKSEMSDPLFIESSGSVVVFITVPIEYNGKIVGALMQKNDGTLLNDIANAQDIGETGYAFMVNAEGTVIAHPSTDMVVERTNLIEDKSNESLSNLVEKVVTGNVGNGRYTINGETRNTGYAPIDGGRWSVVVTMSKTEVFGSLDRMFYQLIVATILIAIVGAVLAVGFAGNIAKKVKVASKHLGEMAKGDLTGEIPEVNLQFKDELGDMARALHGMQGSIGGIVKTIKGSSNELEVKSSELSLTAEEIAKLSETITEAISEIAEGTTVQSNELIQITSVLNQFNEKLNIMQEQVTMVDQASRKIDTMAEGSSVEMNELNTSVVKISQTFETFENSIANLGNSITKINNITNLITNVANQTNLLALNASIEAARAGEAGKGFAVVAEEIGTLAEQSRNSSEEINTLITDISKETNILVTDAADMGQELKSQVDTIHRSISVFQEIIDEIGDVIPKIQSVKDSGLGIEQDKNTILERIDELSSISEEISASTEEISASTEELNGSITNVADSAKLLNSMTEDMIQNVGQFKID